jgi:hypothetical protein
MLARCAALAGVDRSGGVLGLGIGAAAAFPERCRMQGRTREASEQSSGVVSKSSEQRRISSLDAVVAQCRQLAQELVQIRK